LSYNNKLVLVTGATGNQGGAVVRNLLDNGWSVRGLTRNTSSQGAKTLNDTDAEVVQGDLDDRTSLDSALDGIYGVYSFPNLSRA